jgi:hypothetical protein
MLRTVITYAAAAGAMAPVVSVKRAAHRRE